MEEAALHHGDGELGPGVAEGKGTVGVGEVPHHGDEGLAPAVAEA